MDRNAFQTNVSWKLPPATKTFILFHLELSDKCLKSLIISISPAKDRTLLWVRETKIVPTPNYPKWTRTPTTKSKCHHPAQDTPSTTGWHLKKMRITRSDITVDNQQVSTKKGNLIKETHLRLNLFKKRCNLIKKLLRRQSWVNEARMYEIVLRDADHSGESAHPVQIAEIIPETRQNSANSYRPYRWVLISKSLETTKIPGWPEAGVIRWWKSMAGLGLQQVSDLDHHWQIETAAPSRTAWRHQAPATGSLLKYIVSKIAPGITWCIITFHIFPPLKCIKIAILLHHPKSIWALEVSFFLTSDAFSAQRRTLRKNAMTWLTPRRTRQKLSHSSWVSAQIAGFLWELQYIKAYQGISRLLGYGTSQEGNNILIIPDV